MIYSELKTAFKIYDRIEKQDRFLKKNVLLDVKLLSPSDTPLPFQFRVPVADGGLFVITEWKVMRSDGTLAYNLGSNISHIENVRTNDGFDYVIYKGQELTVSGVILNMLPDAYYLEITVNGLKYYSEVFLVPCEKFSIMDTSSSYTRIEWDNGDCDLGPIMYKTGFKNVIFLDSGITREEPTIEEEGFEDGVKNFIPSIQKYVDNLVIEDALPFFMSDSLVLAQLHKNVTVTLPFNTYSSKIRNLQTTMAMQEPGGVYLTTLRFQQDTHYLKGSCCDNIELFKGCEVIIKNITAEPRNDGAGWVDFTWEVEGGIPSSIIIRDKSVDTPCALRNQVTISGDITEYSVGAFSSGNHEIEIIPVCNFFGVDYEGTSGLVNVLVSGSTYC